MVKSKTQKPAVTSLSKRSTKPAAPSQRNTAGPADGANHPSAPDASNGNGSTKLERAVAPDNPLANAHHAFGCLQSQSGVDLTEKVKELLRLAQEQGYLTYNDINDALPDSIITAEELDEIYIKLRNLDIEIVDQAEVDRVKQPEPEEEEDKGRLDILDDPVRMYLKQMGAVDRKSVV